MSFELKGKLVVKEDTAQISDSFRKREFVIEAPNERNSDWNDFVKFQLTQDRCDILDQYNIGDELTVNFNIRGRKWNKQGNTIYITNLEAWKIDRDQPAVSGSQIPPISEDDIPPASDEEDNDLPF